MSGESKPHGEAAVHGTRWGTVVAYDTTTSTNDVAVAWVSANENPHVVVTAREQTAGRGRLGRPWVHTAPGGYVPDSLAVTVTLPAIAHAAQVPFAVALAAYDTLVAFGVEPAVKWPNDLLLNGEKTAGILVERVSVASFDLLVIGTGFNVDWRGVTFSGAARWTSLAHHVGADVDRDVLLGRYLTRLHDWLDVLAGDDGNVTVLDTYRDRCHTLGRSVTVTLANGGTFTGIAEALTASGELLVRCGGTLERVTSGDVWHNL